jgi:hypothetical protein
LAGLLVRRVTAGAACTGRRWARWSGTACPRLWLCFNVWSTAKDGEGAGRAGEGSWLRCSGPAGGLARVKGAGMVGRGRRGELA